MSERIPSSVYDCWRYQVVPPVNGTNGNYHRNVANLYLPAFITERILEDEWSGYRSGLQLRMRDALAKHLNVMRPTLAIRPDMPFVGMISEAHSAEALIL